MGTNYYWHEKPPCECCKREFASVHIGKSSAGWCFSLHVYPHDGVATIADWEARFDQAGTIIRNEYGDDISPTEMKSIIRDRSWKPSPPDAYKEYGSREQFLRKNHALDGPNNLLRHQLMPGRCIAHGEGTWDYLVGDFS